MLHNYRKGIVDKVRSFTTHDLDYQRPLNHEQRYAGPCLKLRDPVPILHYWWNTRLAPQKLEPFGITDARQFFYLYIKKYHERFPARNIRVASFGTGGIEMECSLARKLVDAGIATFTIDCIDVTATGTVSQTKCCIDQDVVAHVFMRQGGVDHWIPEMPCDIVLCNESLHHVFELEALLTMVKIALVDEGMLLVADVIGKNGHQLWPESLGIVEEFWRQLPARYKYNHLLERLELRYANHDYSAGSLEGIRSQDILPLLNALFNFELFIPFANIIPVFVDSAFGHNFNAHSEWDQDFIDRVHQRDEQGIRSGELKPAQMLAALGKETVAMQLVDPKLTPDFCIRHTGHR